MDEVVLDSEDDVRLALVYSLLSNVTVKFPLQEKYRYVKSFVKLLQKITFGSKKCTEGNFLKFIPGSLKGGNIIVKCEDEVSAYIQPLLVLCPFFANPLKIRFKGITNAEHCVDVFKVAHFSVLKKFGIDGCELFIKKRGFAPEGRGEVVFTTQGLRKVCTIDLPQNEMLLRVRGLALSSRLCSIPTKEMTDEINELFSDVCKVKVFSSISNKKDSGPSPGLQCAVFAESKNGVYYAVCKDGGMTPKKVAETACKDLLRSIRRGGLFDEKLLYLALSLMALSSSSVGRLCVCKIEGRVVNVLKLLERFFNFKYDIKRIKDSYVIFTTGCGLANIIGYSKY